MTIEYIKEDNDNDSVFIIIDNFLSPEELILYEKHVNNIEDWKGGIYGNNTVPRLQKWYHDDNKYFAQHWLNQNIKRWSSHHSEEWLVNLRTKVQEKINEIFKTIITENNINGCNKPDINSSLINYYRDGNDYIKYHVDDEKIFGDNPTISMLTFGTERTLKFKRIIYNKDIKYKYIKNHDKEDLNKSFVIKPGSLFLMMGSVQKFYCHGVERDCEIKDPRFSLTFREHK
jgi:alkylated DNA repair dioxygenase AlkB